MTTSLTAPSLPRRMACWVYEGLLLFGVLFISGYLFSTLSQSRHALDNRHGLQAFLFLVVGIYFSWFGNKGQTLAMKTWHIRVVDTHGEAISLQRAFLRYVLSWVWFIPPLAILAPYALTGSETAVLFTGWVAIWALLSRFHPQRQFWHDVIAGTRLIHAIPVVPDEKTVN
jgi:uncharacterized RDD family membrane protein YckC